jgi:hypothetical protein
MAVRVQDTDSGQVVTNWSERGTVGELAAMAARAGAEVRKTLLAVGKEAAGPQPT